MNESKAPHTLAAEVLIRIEETLSLTVQDDAHDVMRKGLYEAPKEQPVVISDGPEVRAITTAGKLRKEILPRLWWGQLGNWLGRLPLPPEVTVRSRVAGLALMVQLVPQAEWLAVLDVETGEMVGVLGCSTVLRFAPSPQMADKTLRAADLLVWGDPDIEHDYYYCEIEDRYYDSNAVVPDTLGRMRDHRGHLVEKCSKPN